MRDIPTAAEARADIERAITRVWRVGRAEGEDVTAEIDDLLERWHSADDLVRFMAVVTS